MNISKNLTPMFRTRQKHFQSCFVYPIQIAIRKQAILKSLTKTPVEVIEAGDYHEDEIWDERYGNLMTYSLESFQHKCLYLHKRRSEEKDGIESNELDEFDDINLEEVENE